MPYSGSTGPDNVIVEPGDIITWVTDETKAWEGWTICLETRAPSAAPSAVDETGTGTGLDIIRIIPPGMVAFSELKLFFWIAARLVTGVMIDVVAPRRRHAVRHVVPTVHSPFLLLRVHSHPLSLLSNTATPAFASV